MYVIYLFQKSPRKRKYDSDSRNLQDVRSKLSRKHLKSYTSPVCFIEDLKYVLNIQLIQVKALPYCETSFMGIGFLKLVLPRDRVKNVEKSRETVIRIEYYSILTPYYRLSRLQMQSGTQKINKLNEI